MGRRDPGFTYREYDADLYMVGYSSMRGSKGVPGAPRYENEPRLFILSGKAVIQEQNVPPFERYGRFVPKAWLDMYNSTGVIENRDYYGIGMFIGPDPDTPMFQRVWVPEGYPSMRAIKGLIASIEDYMLDGYTPQDILDDQLTLYGTSAT